MSNQHLLPRAPLRIAAAQAQPVRGDVSANVARVVELIEAAADDRVELVVFPEKFLSGYEPDLIHSDPQRYAVGERDTRLDPIVAACRRRSISALVGAATWHGKHLSISTIVFASSGAIVGQYHKQHLFIGERKIFSAGESGCILELGDWRLGLGICYDSGFPEHARAAATNGAHAYLVSALFGVGNGYHESRIWLPARALDNTMYTLMSNHVGKTGGWNACGRSGVWSPYGDIIAEGSAEGEGVVVADLDPERLVQVRNQETMLIDVGQHAPGQRFVHHRLGGATGSS